MEKHPLFANRTASVSLPWYAIFRKAAVNHDVQRTRIARSTCDANKVSVALLAPNIQTVPAIPTAISCCSNVRKVLVLQEPFQRIRCALVHHQQTAHKELSAVQMAYAAKRPVPQELLSKEVVALVNQQKTAPSKVCVRKIQA